MNALDLINELDPTKYQCTTEYCTEYLAITYKEQLYDIITRDWIIIECPKCKRKYVNTNPITWIEEKKNIIDGIPRHFKEFVYRTHK